MNATTETFPSGPESDTARWFIFAGSKLLVKADGLVPPVLTSADVARIEDEFLRTHHIGTDEGMPCYAAEVAEDFAAPGVLTFKGLRSLLAVLDERLFQIAGRAFQIIDWDRSHRYCSRCGSENRPLEEERALACPACGLTNYPEVTPAVIVAVTKGREILLARAQQFKGGFHSVLAGFVEPGETLEECVQREVREEVGIEVGGIRYFGSQPWPFPHSLMIAFTAEYVSGEIVIDDREIADASWYRADALPQIPLTGTIARKLIDRFVKTQDSRGQGFE